MTQSKTHSRHKRLLIILAAAAVFMFAFGYALVPIYNTMCRVLGINGKTNGTAAIYSAERFPVQKDRWVTVEFIATNNASLPWKFYPLKKKIRLHPGQLQKFAFFAENDSGKTMTIQAIPSITPGIAAQYFKKVECFCFAQQTLKSHQSMNMPLVFHIDPKLPKNVHTITLSYTIFDVSKPEITTG